MAAVNFSQPQFNILAHKKINLNNRPTIETLQTNLFHTMVSAYSRKKQERQRA